ncbi:MAG: LysR substrate-binding domain-containing protein [Burkholderiaceae bacterium]
MDAQSLALFVEIVDAGNLSEAARRLKMTRANVSYRLQQLERGAGVQLMRRTTRRAEPTEVGLRLYEHGRRIQDELSAARESVATLGRSLRGRVRVSVPSGYGQTMLARPLLAFKQRYPDIVLDVIFENRIEDLLRDEVDIAIRVLSEPPRSLVSHQLGPVTMIACAARDYAQRHALPRDLAELRAARVVTSNATGRQLRVAASLNDRRHEVVIEPTLISENFLFLRQAILAGIGIGLVPEYLVADDLRSGSVLRALADWRLSLFGSQVFMLYMPSRRHPRALTTFIEFMVATAAAPRAVG